MKLLVSTSRKSSYDSIWLICDESLDWAADKDDAKEGCKKFGLKIKSYDVGGEKRV